MNPSIFDLFFLSISLLALLILKHLNKLFKRIKNEFINEGFQNNGNDKKMEDDENTHYYIVRTTENIYKIYENTNKLAFNLSGIITIESSGSILRNIPIKIIIYFNDIFQLKYKYFIINNINANKKK